MFTRLKFKHSYTISSKQEVSIMVPPRLNSSKYYKDSASSLIPESLMFRQPRRTTLDRYFNYVSGLMPSSLIPLHSAKDITSRPLAPPRLRSTIMRETSVCLIAKPWNFEISKSEFKASYRCKLFVLLLYCTRFCIEVILSQPSRYNSLKKKGLANSDINERVLSVTCGQNFRLKTCRYFAFFSRLVKPISALAIA